MKKFFLSIVLVIFFSFVCTAQTTTPTTSISKTGTSDDEIVKISTDLIQVDVTVTDGKGSIITDLKSEEVEIYENGKKEPISNFSFVSNVNRSSEIVNQPKAKDIAPGAPAPPIATLKPEQIKRTIALVVDDLSLSFESTHFVREALKKFVSEQMQEGDLVAIIRTGAGVGALQQFTPDKRLLYQAIEKIRWSSFGNSQSGAFGALEKLPLGHDDQIKQQQEMDREVKELRESTFATGTLGALNYVVRGMQNLPGRKSVMLLSDGFSLYTRTEAGLPESTRVLDAIRWLADAANRASVTINTMDARGIHTTNLTAADDTDSRDFDQIEAELTDRRDKLFDTQLGLQYLARETGGKAYTNNNDLSSEIRKTLDDQSYYLIGYQPDGETFDAAKRRFNRLEVRVLRKNVKVRYRSGFFGITSEKLYNQSNTAAMNNSESSAVAKQTPQQQVMSALLSPFAASDISLHLNVLFASDAKEGSYLKPFLHVDGGDLKFIDEPGNRKKAVFDIVAVIFGDRGEIIDQISKTYSFTPKAEDLPEILKNGFVYQLKFPIKKPGAYQFRVALRDQQTSKVGSANQFIEVPNLKGTHLTLSSIILDNVTADELKNGTGDDKPMSANMLNDVSLLNFKKGTILRYGAEIYNASAKDAARLQTQVKIFRDGKVFSEGNPKPLLDSADPPANSQPIHFVGALNLGNAIPAGDYVLQVLIIDNQAVEASRKYTTQWIQFEVTN